MLRCSQGGEKSGSITARMQQRGKREAEPDLRGERMLASSSLEQLNSSPAEPIGQNAHGLRGSSNTSEESASRAVAKTDLTGGRSRFWESAGDAHLSKRTSCSYVLVPAAGIID
eukprot:1393727-Rhodomonas_salina.1